MRLRTTWRENGKAAKFIVTQAKADGKVSRGYFFAKSPKMINLSNRNPYTDPGWWQRLLASGRLCFNLLRDRRVAWSLKLIPLAAVIYLLLPCDLLPDFVIPGLGQVDDLLVLYLACRLFLGLVPNEILRDYETRDAGKR